MHSLNRPNAPDRLPSADFGNLFSRPRALCASDPFTPSSVVSPLSFPPNPIGAQSRKLRTRPLSEFGSPNSNLSSVFPGLATVQGRPNSVERGSGRPGASFQSGEYVELASPPEDPSIREDGSTLIRQRPSSSFSSKGNKSLEILGAARAPDRHKVEEPSQARSDPQWKREHLGGRLGIRFGRELGQREEPFEGFAPSSLGRLGIPSTTSIRRGQTLSDRHLTNTSSNQLLPEESSKGSRSRIFTPKEGLHCRIKRALRIKHESTNSTDEVYPSRDSTAAVLDRVSSNLREIAAKRLLPLSAKTSISDMSIAAPRRHRYRPNSIYSATSSLRERMIGTPPVSTPDPEALYTESPFHRRSAVGLDEDDSPNFLPSEARRISTPPLRDGSTSKARPRGFFFDYHAQQATDDPSQHQTTERVGSVSDDEWYRRELDTIDSESNSFQEFAASVPEHLPNSPLCPRHPSQRSKGNGICPYHGRNTTPPPESRSEMWW